MSRRRLRPDELDLWQQIAKSTDPLHKRRAHTAPEAKPKPKKPGLQGSDPAPDPLVSFTPDALKTEAYKAERPKPGTKLGGGSAKAELSNHVAPQTTSQWLGRDPVNMDSKSFQRLKRGKLRPEARLDLHGMTLDRAHPALNRFILSAQAQGLRLVLVITGKGAREDPYDPMPRPRGVLKRQVPLWLKMAPLTSAVLQVSESHIRHGGEGAYYVYLRRTR